MCGIKWRVFPWESTGQTDPVEDPVLLSYSRCLSADVLCVWRRTWQGQQPPPSAGFDLPGALPPHAAPMHGNPNPYRHTVRHSPKELWVFWYREEPDLTSLVSPELTKAGEYSEGSVRRRFVRPPVEEPFKKSLWVNKIGVGVSVWIGN